jgi:hypothetical protein
MTFFDAQGNQVQPAEWLSTYERSYFLNQPKQNGQPRNQTSPFVENQVCALLGQIAPLSRQDLTLAMAWKIGLIDHSLSETRQSIEYRQDWPTKLTAKTQFRTLDFSTSIPYLAANMLNIAQMSQGNPRYLYDLAPRPKGFGHVYILTALFFITGGRYPIYDKYANIAALAIDQGMAPGSHVNFKEDQKWSDYQQYMNLILPIGRACPRQVGSASMFMSRPLDRALWVYGHLFETGTNACGTTKPARAYPQTTPKQSVISNEMLVGRICDLCNTASDGWRRREINVRQGSDGYPEVRDSIHLIDSSGAKYPGLTFVEGARLPGHICLGQPGKLKRWFTQRYRSEQVEPSNVYFKPTGQLNEYQIYSEAEWRAAGAPGSRPSVGR